jgi:hypothetical protein
MTRSFANTTNVDSFACASDTTFADDGIIATTIVPIQADFDPCFNQILGSEIARRTSNGSMV